MYLFDLVDSDKRRNIMLCKPDCLGYGLEMENILWRFEGKRTQKSEMVMVGQVARSAWLNRGSDIFEML